MAKKKAQLQSKSTHLSIGNVVVIDYDPDILGQDSLKWEQLMSRSLQELCDIDFELRR